ncbi:MAG: T9SS type A sorting domain-containing protein [Flavobacteriales bacterium]|jgi:hypothetical protein|nr:T9SS type A sorting domain-containing protein [Flavobacteriales bacterium]MBT5089527.1 T9SS type A sorting domain-containing protein [Flavobacteriales bacterium]MBT5750004.1 T9SS type A sorting domain-containing protein [Flavobacteriales bacterium]
MKRILLTLMLTFVFIGANAQCTPDPQYTNAGIYPDSSIGMPDAIVGQAYSEVITIITPTDTNVIFSGLPISVTIMDIALDSVNGLPANFTYDCAALNCVFTGGSTSCAVLSSTINPTVADTGSYQIFMYTTTTVDAGLFGIQTQNDIIDYYYIEVSNATSVINQFNDFTFELKNIFPNPVNNSAKIQFISGNSADVVFSVFNHLGEKIEEKNIAAYRGINDIEISANDYANGMYLYSINNGVQIVSKRMIIAN